jgi:uncharacterized protein (DUF885 family)
MKKREIFIAVLAMLACAGAAPSFAQGTEPALIAKPAETAMGKKLFAVLKDADEDDLNLIPMNGLVRGDARRAGEFGDLITDDFYRRAEGNLKKQIANLKTIDRAQLNAKERIAHDVFKYFAEYALRQHEEGLIRIAQQFPIDHIFGQHIAFQQIASGGGAALYKTVADYDNGLKRFDGFVIYLDRAIVRMREGLRDKRVQPRFISEKVIAQLDTELKNAVADSPFYQPIKNMPADFSETDKSRLETAYREQIENRIRPAFKRLHAFMTAEYVKAGRVDKPGLASMPGGVKYYEYVLESHTTSRISAEAIYKMGMAEVARIHAEMDAVRKRVGFKGSRREFFTHLQSDRQFQFDSKEALLDGYREVQKRVEAAVPAYFSVLPKTRCEIRPYPPEQESSGGGAYYLVGTPDGKRPGVFFVNTSNLPTRTTPRMTSLFMHEGVPGHHLQGSLATEDESLPPILRFGWNPGYGEGWALYAEWLGNEMGLYKDPYQYFGRLDMEIFRAARLVVDTGLHARGWSRRQAIDYMLANTTLDRDAVEQEVDRYIVWPGQATSYKVGELFIRDLRGKAGKRLGKKFDVRAFHDQVLNTGALPLHVLGTKIGDWIAAELRR